MSQVPPIPTKAVEADGLGRRLRDWTCRGWVVSIVLASALTLLVWPVSHHRARYGPRKLYASNEYLADGRQRLTIAELEGDEYTLWVVIFTDRAPAAAPGLLGRDTRDPDVADMGGWRAPGGLVVYSDRYRDRSKERGKSASMDLGGLPWAHDQRVRMHATVPALALFWLFLLSLVLPPVRRAAGWWVTLLLRGAGVSKPPRHGFPVGPPTRGGGLNAST